MAKIAQNDQKDVRIFVRVRVCALFREEVSDLWVRIYVCASGILG